MTTLLLLLVFLLLFLIFTSLVIFVIGPGMLLQPYRRTTEYYRRAGSALHPSEIGLRFEELTLKTGEGIPLSCWLLFSDGPPRGSVLYLHGVSEWKIAGLPMAEVLVRRGFTVFLYDAPRHGDPEKL